MHGRRVINLKVKVESNVERNGELSMVRTRTPSILTGEQAPLLVDADLSLFGPEERGELIRFFDEYVRKGGRADGKIEEFECLFAEKLGVEHVIAVNSATSGLFLALLACGIGSGDEVLIPPYTFAATAHAILHAGAVPVFTDINLETLCISPSAIRQRITKKTKAIVVVHIGGKPAEMDEIIDIGKENGLRIIEDCAQAHGATYKGKHVGTFGDGGVFSFGTKLMTSFRGGVITTHDKDIAATCRRLRYHGLEKGRYHYLHREPGFNMTMTPLQAALLIPQIRGLDSRFELRHRNGTYLAERLNRIPGLKAVVGPSYSKSNFYMLEVLYNPAGFEGLEREHFINALTMDGVPVSSTALAPYPIYRNPSIEKYATDLCPVAEKVYQSLVIMGHLMQSLVLQGSKAVLDEILDRITAVHEHSKEIVELFNRRSCRK